MRSIASLGRSLVRLVRSWASASAAQGRVVRAHQGLELIALSTAWLERGLPNVVAVRAARSRDVWNRKQP